MKMFRDKRTGRIIRNEQYALKHIGRFEELEHERLTDKQKLDMLWDRFGPTVLAANPAVIVTIPIKGRDNVTAGE